MFKGGGDRPVAGNGRCQFQRVMADKGSRVVRGVGGSVLEKMLAVVEGGAVWKQSCPRK